jgi:signal transduction histidine kinase
LRKTNNELATVMVVSQDVVSTLDLDYLLELIMNQLEQVLGFDAVSIHLFEEGVLKSRASRFNSVIGVSPPESLAYDEIPVFREMVDSLKGFVLADMQEYPAMMSAIIASSETAFKDIPASVHSFMAAPLAVRSSAIGMLAVSSASPNMYNQESLNLLQAFANQAAIAIENAQLYDQAQETAVLEERNRLARELHDSVTQTLYSTNLFADAAHLALSADRTDEASQNLDAARDLIWQAMLEMRVLLFELRPPLLEEQHLVGALQTRLESVEARVELPIDFRVEGERRLPPNVEAELYYVALEALNNVAKHARATQVTVHLKMEKERCFLTIQDDGIGFDPEAASLGGGQGLRGMQERIEQIGGRLKLETAPGSGTTIKVEVNA